MWTETVSLTSAVNLKYLKFVISSMILATINSFLFPLA
jgi:hypothetical protein